MRLPSGTLARLRLVTLALAVLSVLGPLPAILAGDEPLAVRLVAPPVAAALAAGWLWVYRRGELPLVADPLVAAGVTLMAEAVPASLDFQPLMALLFHSLYGSALAAAVRVVLIVTGLAFVMEARGDGDAVLGRAIGLAIGAAGMQFLLRSLTRQEREEEAFGLLEGAKDHAVFMLDGDGRVRSWNASARRMLGYEDAEIVGRHLSTLYPADEPAAAAEALTSALQRGSVEVEGWRTRKDGSRLCGEMVITALRGERAADVRYSVILRDLTPRRDAEAALEESEARLRTVVKSAPILLWALDRDGVVRLCEGGRLDLLDFDPRRLIGRHLEDIRDANPQFLSDNRRALAGEALRSTVEYRGRTFETRYSPLREDGDGAISGVIGVATDVTAEQIADRLQRSLLPPRLPDLPGLAMGARYHPGASGAAVGGDWYDVVPLSDGRVAVSVGDVTGHGVEAASTMGQLRNAFLAAALEYESPSAVLERVNALAPRFSSTKIATALYGVLDRSEHVFRYASAGHLPPVVIDEEGSASIPQVLGSLPLGALELTGYVEQTVTVAPGSAVLLYTDGLVELPGRSLTERLEELRAVAAEGPWDAGELCDYVIGRMAPGGAARDDVAVLALRELARPTDSLELRLPATPGSLARVREEMARWLRALEADARQAERLIVACGEACTNAIEHAYGPQDAEVRISGWVDGDDVELTVADDGQWRPPRGTGRGRGLPLMRALVKVVEIASDASGTRVRLRQPIRRHGDAAHKVEDRRR